MAIEKSERDRGKEKTGMTKESYLYKNGDP